MSPTPRPPAVARDKMGRLMRLEFFSLILACTWAFPGPRLAFAIAGKSTSTSEQADRTSSKESSRRPGSFRHVTKQPKTSLSLDSAGNGRDPNAFSDEAVATATDQSAGDVSRPSAWAALLGILGGGFSTSSTEQEQDHATGKHVVQHPAQTAWSMADDSGEVEGRERILCQFPEWTGARTTGPPAGRATATSDSDRKWWGFPRDCRALGASGASGYTFSGGGHRAAATVGGFLKAMQDLDHPAAPSQPTYIGAVSGGAWGFGMAFMRAVTGKAGSNLAKTVVPVRRPVLSGSGTKNALKEPNLLDLAAEVHDKQPTSASSAEDTKDDCSLAWLTSGIQQDGISKLPAMMQSLFAGGTSMEAAYESSLMSWIKKYVLCASSKSGGAEDNGVDWRARESFEPGTRAFPVLVAGGMTRDHRSVVELTPLYTLKHDLTSAAQPDLLWDAEQLPTALTWTSNAPAMVAPQMLGTPLTGHAAVENTFVVDGGAIDNNGILPLLRRGVQRIITIHNSPAGSPRFAPFLLWLENEFLPTVADVGSALWDADGNSEALLAAVEKNRERLFGGDPGAVLKKQGRSKKLDAGGAAGAGVPRKKGVGDWGNEAEMRKFFDDRATFSCWAACVPLEFQGLFGLLPRKKAEERGKEGQGQQAPFEYGANQVFSHEAFLAFAQATQTAVAEGLGAVATLRLRTLRNEVWSVRGGDEVHWTVLQASGSREWWASRRERVEKWFPGRDEVLGTGSKKKASKEAPLQLGSAVNVDELRARIAELDADASGAVLSGGDGAQKEGEMNSIAVAALGFRVPGAAFDLLDKGTANRQLKESVDAAEFGPSYVDFALTHCSSAPGHAAAGAPTTTALTSAKPGGQEQEPSLMADLLMGVGQQMGKEMASAMGLGSGGSYFPHLHTSDRTPKLCTALLMDLVYHTVERHRDHFTLNPLPEGFYDTAAGRPPTNRRSCVGSGGRDRRHALVADEKCWSPGAWKTLTCGPKSGKTAFRIDDPSDCKAEKRGGGEGKTTTSDLDDVPGIKGEEGAAAIMPSTSTAEDAGPSCCAGKIAGNPRSGTVEPSSSGAARAAGPPAAPLTHAGGPSTQMPHAAGGEKVFRSAVATARDRETATQKAEAGGGLSGEMRVVLVGLFFLVPLAALIAYTNDSFGKAKAVDKKKSHSECKLLA